MALPEVPELAYKIIVSVFFALAIIAAALRISIKIYWNKCLSADDKLLVLACTTLVGAIALEYQNLPDNYLSTAVMNGPSSPALVASYLEIVASYNRIGLAHEVLQWTTIYLVKASFLSFFARLISRTANPMTRYLKILAGACLIGWLLSITYDFAVCPPYNVSQIETQCSNPYKRLLALLIPVFVFDIVTDVLIFAIPIRLLRSIQLDLRSKMKLAAFLCLGVINIFLAVVRFPALQATGGSAGAAVDATWIAFWTSLEMNLAVLMVSATAFRSLFPSVYSKQRARKASPQWYSRSKILNRKRASPDTIGEDLESLPAIPSSTFTGGRTQSCGGSRETSATRTNIRDQGSPEKLLSISEGRILVTHDISAESANASKQASRDGQTSFESFV